MLCYPKSITVCEVSTRDGFQSLPFEIETEDKLELLEQIADAGIREIEVGSFVPGASEDQWKMSKTPEVFRRMARRRAWYIARCSRPPRVPDRPLTAAAASSRSTFPAAKSIIS